MSLRRDILSLLRVKTLDPIIESRVYLLFKNVLFSETVRLWYRQK